MKKCHSVYSFPKEQKTLIEIDSDEKSMYHSETQEETIEWRTLVVGGKDSGKSTLICGLLVQNTKNKEKPLLFHRKRNWICVHWKAERSVVDYNNIFKNCFQKKKKTTKFFGYQTFFISEKKLNNANNEHMCKVSLVFTI